MNIGKSAIQAADELREAFVKAGYRLAFDAPTNQIFVILGNDEMARLQEKAEFSFWEKYDKTHTVVRFATSWATTESDTEALRAILAAKPMIARGRHMIHYVVDAFTRSSAHCRSPVRP